MASDVLLGFTIRILYINNVFSCIYNTFETKISNQLGKQMFVYLLLAAATPHHSLSYRQASSTGA